MNLPLALAISSDSYFYNLGELFWNGRSAYGNDAIQNVAAEYGEGQTTGIDLPDEVNGARRQPARTGEAPQRGPGGVPQHELVHR